jgi:adenine-specific DNA-methyltransferase
MSYNNIQTIRYMGNKGRLLDEIIPEIINVTPTNGIVCDLMAGSNSIAYALKDFYTVYTNDVQEYSYVISKALIENQFQNISENTAKSHLFDGYMENKSKGFYTFFVDNYTDTYFSGEQCFDIDSIRYTIEKCKDEILKSLYLTALMGAMCKVQSTPGHFAQYMPKEHKRLKVLRNMDVWEEFIKKCNEYSNIVFTDKENKVFCSDYNKLIDDDILNNVDTLYVDSPYNQEQYSRFYHILETICKYDRPLLDFKAKYRNDRFKSNFCYKNAAGIEFSKIIDYCCHNSINLVISYSEKGIFPIMDLIKLCNEKFPDVKFKEIDFKHSMQGKGNISISEYVIVCTC